MDIKENPLEMLRRIHNRLHEGFYHRSGDKGVWDAERDIDALCILANKLESQLHKYRQAESEGRVDIHPCTEGTAVYVIREVRNHYLEPYHYEIQVMAYKKYMLKNYGKTVFLEKGAAKAALAAKEGEHE